MCLYLYVLVCVCVPTWGSRTICESQFSPSLHSCPWAQTQVPRLGGKCPYPLRQLISPLTYTLTDSLRWGLICLL